MTRHRAGAPRQSDPALASGVPQQPRQVTRGDRLQQHNFYPPQPKAGRKAHER